MLDKKLIIFKTIKKISSSNIVNLLKKHDWFHEMSEDMRYYSKGKEELKEIALELAKLDLKEALKLWNDNSPKSFNKDHKEFENFLKFYKK
jgi:hypothetical protein